MKKQYVSPEMTVLTMELQQVIAASFGISSDPVDEVQSRFDEEFDLFSLDK